MSFDNMEPMPTETPDPNQLLLFLLKRVSEIRMIAGVVYYTDGRAEVVSGGEVMLNDLAYMGALMTRHAVTPMEKKGE